MDASNNTLFPLVFYKSRFVLPIFIVKFVKILYSEPKKYMEHLKLLANRGIIKCSRTIHNDQRWL